MLRFMKVYVNRVIRILKPYYCCVLETIQKVKWYVQYSVAFCQKLYPQRLFKLELNKKEDILVLVPHADDEWIGPYSIISQRPSFLSCVYFNLYGGNNNTENIQKRNDEILASSKYWGFNLVNNFGYDVDALFNLLKNTKLCFVPSPYDWHDEHRKVFQTFVKAYSKLSNFEKKHLTIYYYCVSVPHSNKEVISYIPLSKEEVCKKWRDFSKIYHTQAFMPSLRYILQLRLVPPVVGYSAQQYVMVNEERILNDFLMSNDDKFISKIRKSKDKINNIYSIRKFIDVFTYD